MVVSITGKPGTGKTTLLMRVLSSFDEKVGFYTREIRKGGERIGFIAEASWGEKVLIAKKGLRSRWRVGKYGVDVESFEKNIVIPLMSRTDEADVIYVDEVGKMECFSTKFLDLVDKLLKMEDKLVIFTIPFRDFNDTISRIRKSSDILVDVSTWRDKWDELAKYLLRRWKGW